MPADSVSDRIAPLNDTLRVPRHLAVTMDGNGRWAKARGKARTEGHRAGTDALRKLVELSIRYGIEYLTVFSFSSENWSRPKEEVNFILGLMRRFVASDLDKLSANDVRIQIVGERDGLNDQILALINKAESETAQNTGLKLIIAFNYGGKAEITNAVRRIAKKVRDGSLALEDIGEETVAAELYTVDIPEPDVVLRTSGEQRFSNFLVWQAAYSELVFIEEYWPDFDESVFIKVLEDYSRRERRFGGVEAHIQ